MRTTSYMLTSFDGLYFGSMQFGSGPGSSIASILVITSSRASTSAARVRASSLYSAPESAISPVTDLVSMTLI